VRVCLSWAVLIDRKEVRKSTAVVTDFISLLIPGTYVAVYRLPTVRTAHFVISTVSQSVHIPTP